MCRRLPVWSVRSGEARMEGGGGYVDDGIGEGDDGIGGHSKCVGGEREVNVPGMTNPYHDCHRDFLLMEKGWKNAKFYRSKGH